MRVVSLLVVLLSLSLVVAQEGKKEDQQQTQQKIPATLAEAHAELERILSPQILAEIDALPSEDDMIQYHMGLGLTVRNRWGLWRGSPLAKYMRELGFTHPDDMSDAILRTFWRKRHGQDLHLEELRATAKKAAAAAQKAQEEKEKRVQEAKAAIRKMMMGLRFENRDVAPVQMPIRNGLNVRFLCPFRSGVFLTAYCQGRISSNFRVGERGFYRDPAEGEVRKMKPGDDFYTLGFHFDPAGRKIHRIHVAEVNEVYAAVVVGNRAWFAGTTNGKPVLVGIGERDRITVPLPQEDEIPDLGLDGQSLLAVYSKTIFRLTDRTWTLVHSGDILLPRSGLPPRLHGNMVFLRDEGRGEIRKRLWWLTLGEQLHLSALDRDLGVVGEVALGRGGSSSYCVTRSGDLWACVEGVSLLRRSPDGRYSIAILNGSVRFTEDLLDSRKTDQRLSVSAVTALPDDTLLLAGNAGLYRLKGNELIQELMFTSEEVTDSRGRVVRYPNWNPDTILVLDDQSYVIGCGSWGGVYFLRKGNDSQWRCLPLDDLRDTVVW